MPIYSSHQLLIPFFRIQVTEFPTCREDTALFEAEKSIFGWFFPYFESLHFFFFAISIYQHSGNTWCFKSNDIIKHPIYIFGIYLWSILCCKHYDMKTEEK
jgi:hypothetical protein